METYNPKNSNTMCKEKTTKTTLEHPLFHTLHTHEQQLIKFQRQKKHNVEAQKNLAMIAR
jgi:hypothetical protein